MRQVNGITADTYLVLAGTERIFPLAGARTWAIGRGEGCAVLLDSRSVSRLHALIQRRDAGDHYLVDLGSRNGSFVNGRRVSVPVQLNDNDEVLLAEQKLIFHNSAIAPAGQIPMDTGTRNLPTETLHNQSLATIVVVDIRDFTPLARTLNEALLSQTIGTWFLRVGQEAEKHGSWAQQYIGDAVMAVWVHENASNVAAGVARALRGVCGMNAATHEISRALPLPAPLRIGAGVSTGMAMLGSTDYTALGDTVNAAFRLEEATKSIGFQVALGEAAFEALALPQMLPFQRREVELKGYDSPATAWGISFEDLRIFTESLRV